MANVTVSVKATGIKGYAKRLASINKHMNELDVPMRESGDVTMALVRSYPPYGDWRKLHVSFQLVRPGAKYKRTKELQRGWGGKLTKGSNILVRFRATNRGAIDKRGREYSHYVQGDAQAPNHMGIWYTEHEMGELLHAETLKIFRDFMKKAMRP
jgi:hypothetical protein